MYRAIVVDDEPFMREGMRLMVDYARYGFELSGEAADAAQALALMEARRPHLMITDVMMPGRKGTELAEIVAREYPDTLMIFISGYREFAYAQAAIRARALGYLVKPIETDAVHGLLEEARIALDARAEAPPPGVAEQALAYIGAHYARDLSVREIAAALHLNPAYLGQLVRKNTGQTIHSHLQRVRVEAARRLLRGTGMSVGEIAEAVGVTDTAYFSLIFRKRTGLTPREYRKAKP